MTGVGEDASADFDALMERIDERLKRQGMSIPQRALVGLYEAEAELGRWSANFPGLPRGSWASDEDVKERAARWYEARFGVHVKVDFSPGSLVLLIHGDPWVARLPQIWGRFVFFSGRTDVECALPPGADRPHLNVLDYIGDGGLPAALRPTLTDADCREICNKFKMAFEAYRNLSALATLPLIGAALGNHRAAVQYLTLQNPDHGAAGWSALEALEKVLKAYIGAMGGRFSKDHRISLLAAEATAVGLAPLPAHLVAKLLFGAGVRYREIPVTLTAAVDAHHASLEASQIVVAALLASGKVPTS